MKLVPTRVTEKAPTPFVPLLGVMEVSVGAGGNTTENETVLVVPPGVVTLMVLAPIAARAEIVKFAVTEVPLTTLMPVTVMPVPPATLMAEAPVRLVPVKVTATVAPRMPEVGEIEVRVGVATTPPYSIAPASTDPFVFLRAPKKS